MKLRKTLGVVLALTLLLMSTVVVDVKGSFAATHAQNVSYYMRPVSSGSYRRNVTLQKYRDAGTLKVTLDGKEYMTLEGTSGRIVLKSEGKYVVTLIGDTGESFPTVTVRIDKTKPRITRSGWTVNWKDVGGSGIAKVLIAGKKVWDYEESEDSAPKSCNLKSYKGKKRSVTIMVYDKAGNKAQKSFRIGK